MSRNDHFPIGRFTCYYEEPRLRYLRGKLDSHQFFRVGNTPIRKTAIFVGERFNIYVNFNDGTNESLRTYESSGNAEDVIRHSAGKPFMYFKTAYSPMWSKDVQETVEKAGGKFVPFFKWCGANLCDRFFEQLYTRRLEVAAENRRIEKKFDVGFSCTLDPAKYPRRDILEIRKGLYNILRGFLGERLYHSERMEYGRFIRQSLSWKVAFNPPGVGEYTTRIMDACSIGKPCLIRKTTYDNPVSWKGYVPEIDFAEPNWTKQLEEVIADYETWGEKCLYYFEHYWTPEAIFQYFMSQVEDFARCIG